MRIAKAISHRMIKKPIQVSGAISEISFKCKIKKNSFILGAK